MTGLRTHMILNREQHMVIDTTDSYTCSFTEFFPFCAALYYFSNFKDFNTLGRA